MSDLEVLVEPDDDEYGHKRLDDHHQHGNEEHINRDQVHIRDGDDQVERERARIGQNGEDGEMGDHVGGLAERFVLFVDLSCRRGVDER